MANKHGQNAVTFLYNQGKRLLDSVYLSRCPKITMTDNVWYLGSWGEKACQTALLEIWIYIAYLQGLHLSQT